MLLFLRLKSTFVGYGNGTEGGDKSSDVDFDSTLRVNSTSTLISNSL